MGARKPAMAVCARCKTKKTKDDFSKDRSRNSGYFPWCKECVLGVRKSTRRKRFVGEGGNQCPVCLSSLGEGAHRNRLYCSDSCKDKARRYRTFGLEPEEYRQLKAAAGSNCPICHRKTRRWQLDHNHKTGETYGLVCINCNIKLLAYVYHNPDIAERLRDFLVNPPVRSLFGERRYVGPENVSQLHRMWAWNGEEEVERCA